MNVQDLKRWWNLRRTQVEKPGPRYIYVPARQAGVLVTHDSALTFSAVFAAVRYISQTIGALSWHVFEPQPGGGKRDSPGPVQNALNQRANPEMGAMAWRETMLSHALTYGNGYSEIDRDSAGRMSALWPIEPDRVNPDRVNGTGALVFEVDNGRGANTVLAAQDCFHLHGLGYDGRVGYSVVRYAGRAIGMGIAQDEFGASFYSNGTVVGGVLKHPQHLSDEAYNRLKDTFTSAHGGAAKAFKPQILEEGMEWQPMGMPLEDAQFLGSRQFQVSEVARWFGIQPHKLADLTHATFSNIEHQSIETVTDTLIPWVTRLEQEANWKLLGGNGRRFSKINVNALLRGDVAARSEYYERMARLGVLNINEIRELEDMNPIDGGDARLVPMNMTTLEQIEDPPEPEPAPVPEEEAEPEQDPDMGAMMWKTIMDEAIEFRRQKISAAIARYEDRDAYLAWRDQWFENHFARLQEKVSPWWESRPEGFDPWEFREQAKLNALQRYDIEKEAAHV